MGEERFGTASRGVRADDNRADDNQISRKTKICRKSKALLPLAMAQYCDITAYLQRREPCFRAAEVCGMP